ncbi:MAG: cytochrome c biogenesis protein ResB [Deltaproteobacteria bacterium]|nr:cytochrome c biogenesis protein ResB [Deltaproteobacteria bacterium]
MVSNLRAVSGRMFIPEGRKSSIFVTQDREGQMRRFRLPFEVECEDFGIDYYPGTQQPKVFRSDLLLHVDGEPAFRKHIEVNKPLDYKGFRFFQAFYDELGVMARTRVSGEDGAPLTETMVTLGEVVPLGGADAFALIDFEADRDGQGPAVRLRAIENDKVGDPFWVRKDDPTPAPLGKYQFDFIDLESVFATGLEVSVDPGVKIVWAGAVILIPSLLWALFGYHHRVWLRVEPDRAVAWWTGNKRKPQLEAQVRTALARIEGAAEGENDG